MQNVTTKSTKDQIYAAYKDLKQKFEEMQQSMRGSQTTTSNRTVTSGTAFEDIAQIIGLLERMKVDSNVAFGKLAAVLSSDIGTLEALQHDIDLGLKYLSAVYGIDEISDTTLSDMLQRYADMQKQFQAELDTFKVECANQVQDKQDAWNEEFQTGTNTIREQKNADALIYDRRNAEYQYKLSIKKQELERQLEQLQREQQQALADMREAKEQEWRNIENTLVAMEQEWESLYRQVDEYPAMLERSKRQAEAEGLAIANRQVDAQTRLRKAEIQQILQSQEHERAAKRLIIDKQENTIDSLRQQIDSVQEQMHSIALAAIDMDKQEESLRSLTSIAMEQAKNPKGSK